MNPHRDFNRLDTANNLFKLFTSWGSDYKKDIERYRKKRDEILKELEA
jgi:hypothetical protein